MPDGNLLTTESRRADGATSVTAVAVGDMADD
jgi:hypothetical protein